MQFVNCHSFCTTTAPASPPPLARARPKSMLADIPRPHETPPTPIPHDSPAPRCPNHAAQPVTAAMVPVRASELAQTPIFGTPRRFTSKKLQKNGATAPVRALLLVQAPLATGRIFEHPPPAQGACASIEARAGSVPHFPTPSGSKDAATAPAQSSQSPPRAHRGLHYLRGSTSLPRPIDAATALNAHLSDIPR
ncbi:hypothetical protein HYPSUDRAFT_204399 [Hypholoma sublateritium FD-334 SS-4]|uniref:Uncharacterized protein n=1 Tax=Hypholoma sublateritium (strain FD-334 SS-4) TaxID=945553 RepID=A0A0D2NLD4_HYPSF|nr:hypothetical protein HYPSUDRAFT_204399 [Hypholoma sublateritium FD-334 SS-4]